MFTRAAGAHHWFQVCVCVTDHYHCYHHWTASSCENEKVSSNHYHQQQQVRNIPTIKGARKIRSYQNLAWALLLISIWCNTLVVLFVRKRMEKCFAEWSSTKTAASTKLCLCQLIKQFVYSMDAKDYCLMTMMMMVMVLWWSSSSSNHYLSIVHCTPNCAFRWYTYTTLYLSMGDRKRH